jgi:hypothetical protein
MATIKVVVNQTLRFDLDPTQPIDPVGDMIRRIQTRVDRTIPIFEYTQSGQFDEVDLHTTAAQVIAGRFTDQRDGTPYSLPGYVWTFGPFSVVKSTGWAIQYIEVDGSYRIEAIHIEPGADLEAIIDALTQLGVLAA